MSTIIQVKRTTTANLPSALEQGELAYIYDTSATDTDAGGNGGRLFIGDPTTNTNTPLKIGGKYYTDLMDHGLGALTANAAVLVDSNKSIDELFIGNSTTTGGTLKFNEGTNNGSNFIGLKAPNAVTTSTTFTLPDGDGSTGQFLKTDGSGNLDFATVTTSLTIAGDTGSDDFNTGETLTFTGGEGIDTAVTSNTITISGEDASTTNKGIAQFSSFDFSTTGGVVSIKTGGVNNLQLVSSSITFAGDSGSDSTSLGETLTVAGGTSLSSVATSNTVTISVDNGGIDTLQLAADAVDGTKIADDSIDSEHIVDGSVDNVHLANSSVTVAGDTGSDGVSLGETLTIAGTSNEIETSVSSNTVTVGLPDDVTIGNDLTVTGNLTVNGTTTTLSTTNTAVEDTLLELNTGATSNANDSGLIIERGSTGDNAIFMWDESSDRFTLGTTTATADATGNITITVGELVANIDGSNSTLTNIPNSAFDNSTFSISDDSATTDDIALGETLSIIGGEGIDTAMTSNTLTISGELATTSNKGVASFSSDNFTVTSGAVTVTAIDGGTY